MTKAAADTEAGTPAEESASIAEETPPAAAVISAPGVALPAAVSPRPAPSDSHKTGHPALFFNREASLMDFNWRVLSQALDESNPLLERVRFLAITASNLDEFVMKRFGGLKRQHAAGVVKRSRDGRTPEEQLELLRGSITAMRRELSTVWRETLKPCVDAEAGLVIKRFDELDDDERQHVETEFHKRIYPLLTPLTVDPGHPFPFISNLSLSLAVTLYHPELSTRHFARVKIPVETIGSWVKLPAPNALVSSAELVKALAAHLFRGMRIEEAALFRVIRNADMRRNEEEADDLLRMISEEVRERRFAPVVRLDVEPGMSAGTRQLLAGELELEAVDVAEIDPPLDASGLAELVDLGPWTHRFKPWNPAIPSPLRPGERSEEVPDIWAAIRRRDLMVHHPYDSFTASVGHFIEAAADDPDVLAIKQTVYRTSADSPVINALERAAESGKQVAVLVEVTAAWDEVSNIGWAARLEEAGVHVTYSLVGLKTHAKAALVLRREDGEIRTYCHIGTGNYNSDTARFYTDIGIFTARPEIGTDTVNLFHFLTGYAPEQRYEKLIVGPRDLRWSVLRAIQREGKHARKGRGGRVIMKMNGLDDKRLIRALYAASRSGARIDLIVRGACQLRPGLPDWSENIRVRSIVGRFLEHDRVLWFGNAGEPEVWIGSADLRKRNMVHRVEVLMPVDDADIMARLESMLDLALRDNQRAWSLGPDGSWTRLEPDPGTTGVDYQAELMEDARKRRKPPAL